MSQLSCINAIAEILGDQVLPPLKTITDIEATMPTLPADGGPYCIIQDGKVVERRLSGGIGGSKAVDFPIDLHIFSYYGSIDNASRTDFRTMVDNVQAAVRNAHRLNNLGDSYNSYVLISGENLTTEISPWTEDSSGIYLMHAVVSFMVNEIVTDNVALES